MGSLTYILRDKDTAIGIPGQDVKMRIGPAFVADADTHTYTDVTGKPGSYMITDSSGVRTGFYKMYVNNVVDDSFGGANGREIIRGSDLLFKSGGTMAGDINMNSNRITNLPDPASNGEAETQGSADAKYLKLTGGTLSGPVDADGQRITNLPNPASDGEAETKGSADTKFLKLSGGTMTGQIAILPAAGDANPVRKDFAESTYAKKGAQLITPVLVEIFNLFRFRFNPQLVPPPSGPFDITNVKFVEDYVNNYLNGTTPTYQQTETMIIIDFNGTQEDNRRYITVESGLAQANEYASADLRVVLFIEGSGNDDTSLLPNYNRLPPSYDPYIDIVGIEQSVILTVDESENYASANLGENNISNVTLFKETGAAPTGLTKKILRNVKFTSEDGIGQYDLTNCVLENCSRQGATVTTSGCIGNILDISNSQEFILHKLLDAGGAYEIAFPNGDIRGKRILGRQGTDAASDEEIALTEGNYHVVTGTTDIKWIRNTGWTDGSEITLDFPGGLTLIHSVIGIDPQAGILTNTGADKTFAAGALAKFVLTGNGTFWKEI